MREIYQGSRYLSSGTMFGDLNHRNSPAHFAAVSVNLSSSQNVNLRRNSCILGKPINCGHRGWVYLFKNKIRIDKNR